MKNVGKELIVLAAATAVVVGVNHLVNDYLTQRRFKKDLQRAGEQAKQMMKSMGWNKEEDA